MDREQTLERVYALGYEFEGKYGNCPQCTLAAIQEVLGGIDDEVFKAATALAAGGALTTQGTCGALSGGMMAISARFGRDRASFSTTSSRKASVVAKRLYDRFIAAFGSPICATVQVAKFGRSYDMWDKDDYRAFEAAGGHVDKCTDVVGQTAKWTAEILLEAAEDENRSK